ncbi:MAG: DUF1016 N-terminal domain-containing protein, partial [Planctomycetes bacterium]|nr:DUF1016 N-terminal domain-containing protein [Planctomycetota bacterium]
MGGKIIPGYAALLEACRRLAQGSLRESRASLVETYWELGANINRAVGEARAAYGAATVMRLSRDLGVSKTDLYNAMALACRFGKDELSPGLTWSHYRTLLALGTNGSRTLASRAARSCMTVRQLRREVLRRRNGRNRRLEAVYGGG